MLKFIYQSKSDIPAGLESYCEEKDGKWYLKIEGAVAKDRLDEMRDNKIKVDKELEDLKKKFEGLDPDEYKKLKANKDLLDEKKLVTAEGLEAAVEARIAKAKEEHAKTLADRESKLSAANAELARLKIDGALIEAGVSAGLRKEAHADLVARGRAIFSLDDQGRIVAKGPDGKEIYGVDGQMKSVREYVGELAKSAPHLFTPSNGGGAPGSGKVTEGIENPWLAGTFNVSKQMEILAKDPDAGKRLQTAAAVANAQK